MDTEALKTEFQALALKHRWSAWVPLDDTLDRMRMEQLREVLKANCPSEPLVRPVPEANRKAFLKDIASINRRAAKLGCEPITLDWGPEVFIEFVKPLTRDEEYASAVEGASIDREIVNAKCQLVHLTGNPPALPGWELIGIIEPLPTGENLFRPSPGKSFPEKYRKVSGTYCDHCKADRKRKDTVLVRQTETGEYKQVGRNCIVDFFHGQNPTSLLFHAEQYFKLDRRFSPPGGMNDEWNYSLKIAAFLAHAAQSVRLTGRFVTAAEAKIEAAQNDRMVYPTGSEALTEIARASSRDDKERAKYQLPTQEDWDTGQAALDWVLDSTDNGEFMTNLRTLFKVGFMTPKHANLAAWSIKGYMVNVEKAKVERARLKVGANSGHIGTLGKRQIFRLRYLGRSTYDTEYGRMQILKFLDAAGNLVIWSTSDNANLEHDSLAGPKSYELEIGFEYELKGTPKRHNEYKGVKQTSLNRVVILKATAAPELKGESPKA